MDNSKFIPPSSSKLEDFLKRIEKELRGRKAVVKIEKGPVLFVGDIHGYYQNVADAIRLGADNSVSTIVFMGDYTDRGPNQLKCLLNLLFAYVSSRNINEHFGFLENNLFEDLPFKIITLRGNHENIEINKRYGFGDVIRKIYGESFPFEKLFSNLYDFLPLMAETSWNSLAVHGGIPRVKKWTNLYETFSNLRSLKLPLHENPDKVLSSKMKTFIFQLQWNDPNENLTESTPLFRRSFRGDQILTFNRRALTDFFKDSGYKRLIRSHESSRGPYQILWNGRLIHVFSAHPYMGRIKTPAFYLEYKDGTGKIINHKGKTLKRVKSMI
jgi:hypothetical protein